MLFKDISNESMVKFSIIIIVNKGSLLKCQFAVVLQVLPVNLLTGSYTLFFAWR